MIDPAFWGINRLFDFSLKNDNNDHGRDYFNKY